MHRHLKQAVLVMFMLSVWQPALVLSQTAPTSAAPDARAIMRKGTVEIGVMGAYWQAFDPWGDAISTDRSAVMVLPRIGKVISRTFDASIFSGNVELVVEPFYARFFRPFAADAYGGTIGFKYNFVSFGRWMPFWDIGIGGVYTNLAPRLPEQSTRVNVVLQSGPGLHYFMSTTSTFTVGVRMHHISNAGFGDRNEGLNAIMPYFGLSFFF